MIYKIHRVHQLNCDIETAWEFFSSPHNLSQLTPKELQLTVLGNLPEGLHKGMIIDYKLYAFPGIPVKWRTKITQVYEGKSFTDFQQAGPYKMWNHFHEFIPNENGVLVKDTIDYELPMGLLGSIAHSLLVRNKLNYIFDYRYQQLEKLFNTFKSTS